MTNIWMNNMVHQVINEIRNKKTENKKLIAIVKSASTYSTKITGSDRNFFQRICITDIYSF